MNQTLLLGILAAMLFTEFTGLSPGGLIVPAYFALYWGAPFRMLETVLLALLCMGLVRLFSSFMILYGRRRYAVFLLTGILLKLALTALVPGNFHPIGILIPGILGRELERQGIPLTLLSLGAVTLLTHLLFLVFHSL